VGAKNRSGGSAPPLPLTLTTVCRAHYANASNALRVPLRCETGESSMPIWNCRCSAFGPEENPVTSIQISIQYPMCLWMCEYECKFVQPTTVQKHVQVVSRDELASLSWVFDDLKNLKILSPFYRIHTKCKSGVDSVNPGSLEISGN